MVKKGKIKFRLILLSTFIIGLIPLANFAEADSSDSYVTPPATLLLDKTAVDTNQNNTTGRDIFRLDLKVESKPTFVNKSYDYVLVLDTSDSMNARTPITTAPSTSLSYYINDGGIYYQATYLSSSSVWKYVDGSSRTRYVIWSATNNYQDPGTAGKTNTNNPVPKPFYTTATRLSEMKTVLNNFLQTLFTKNSSARVALVDFNGSTTSTITHNLSGGLVNISNGSGVTPALTNIINNLTASGTAHSNSGLALAHQILRNQSTVDTNKQIVFFTDGEPGMWGFSDTGKTSGQITAVGGSNSGSRYAAAAINQANQLKATWGSTISSDVTFNGYQARNVFGYYNQTTMGTGAITNGAGAGAVVYALGLMDLNVSTLVDSYMNNIASTASDQTYFRSTTSNGINTALQTIANKTVETTTQGTTYSNISVRDYIDPRFQLVNLAGIALNVGQTITIGSNTGTIMQDAKGIYVNWNIVSLTPGYVADGKGYILSAYVVAKDNFIGGNGVPTNKANITAVYDNSATNIGSFPNPLVNVPFNFSTSDIKSYVLLGKGIPYTMNQVQTLAFQLDGTYNGSYPNGLITYSFPESFDQNTVVVANHTYAVNVTANAVKYIDLSDISQFALQVDGTYKKGTGEIYKTAVNSQISAVTKTANYVVSPIAPTIAVNSRTIQWGNTVGEYVKDLLDISFQRPAGINDTDWSTLSAQVPGYINAITATFSTPEIAGTYSNEDLINLYPSRAYESNADPLTLNVNLSYNGTNISSNVHPNIYAISSALTITKITNDNSGNQTFIFNINRNNSKITTISLKSNESTTIKNIKNGQYVVTEDESWSWRYKVDGSNPNIVTTQTTITSQGINNGIGTYTISPGQITFKNNKTKVNWQSGVSDAINVLRNYIWEVE